MMEELVLNEVYGVWPTSFWQTLPGYAILTILGISVPLLGVIIFKAIRAYQEGTSKDKALRSLAALSKKVQDGTSDMRMVYQELTDIIKGFAHWRYVIPYGTTDYELLSLLKQVDCTAQQRSGIERIMVDAQGVKFGKALAPKEQVLNDITTVVSFVEAAGDRPE